MKKPVFSKVAKKSVAGLLAGLMVAASLAGCSGGSDNNDTTDEENTAAAGDEGVDLSDVSEDAIRILNGKIEIDSALKAWAQDYEARTGQEVVIESLGGGVDIAGQIKNYAAAGNMPDIFAFGGEQEYVTFKDMMADLSGEDWVDQTDFSFLGENDEVVGFPFSIEGYGITYNKDILDQAGVDPATLTSYAAYEEAFAKIDGMKEELGIDAVVSAAAESGQMYWSTGNHIFGYYLSGGLDREDKTYIDMLHNGEVDEARLTQFAKFVEMLFEYSDQNVLISGTYDDQLALWAQGKSAFVIQGNWIDASLDDYGVEFDCGIAPFAFTEEEMTGVLADSPSWWAVHADGDKIDACKAILNDLVSTEEGQKALVTDAALISPYDTVDLAPTTPLAISLSEYIQANNTYAWDWTSMPEGIAQNATGGVFELFAKGDLDVDTFVSLFASTVADYVE